MDKTFNEYIQKVEKYLKPLPSLERMDILKEINSQILELENAGKTKEDILQRLGSPKELAKSYLSLLIGDEKSLLRNKVLAICAYYTLASFTGMIIIPILFICATVFIFCGVATPIISLIKMFDYLLNLGLPYMDHVGTSFGSLQMNPILGFLISLPMAALLFGAGRGCWKLLLAYIKGIKQIKRHVSDNE